MFNICSPVDSIRHDFDKIRHGFDSNAHRKPQKTPVRILLPTGVFDTYLSYLCYVCLNVRYRAFLLRNTHPSILSAKILLRALAFDRDEFIFLLYGLLFLLRNDEAQDTIFIFRMDIFYINVLAYIEASRSIPPA